MNNEVTKILEVASRYGADPALIAAARCGAELALMAVKNVPEIITLADCKRLYGRTIANQLRMSPEISWRMLGKGGSTSGAYAIREEVSTYILNHELNAAPGYTFKKTKKTKTMIRL